MKNLKNPLPILALVLAISAAFAFKTAPVANAVSKTVNNANCQPASMPDGCSFGTGTQCTVTEGTNVIRYFKYDTAVGLSCSITVQRD